MVWLIPLSLMAWSLIGVFALAMSAEERRTVPDELKPKPLPKGLRRRRFRAAVAAAAVPDAWLRFLEAAAKHESNFQPRQHNDRPGEVAASRILNERNGVVGGVDFDTPEWTYGSKGLFQFLGGNIAIRKGKLRFSRSVTNPDMAYDPGISIAAALDYARGLMGWKQFAGTWASLWVGWDNPSRMNDPAKLMKSAASLHSLGLKLGWPDGWADERAPALPKRGRAALGSLAKAADFAYRGVS